VSEVVKEGGIERERKTERETEIERDRERENGLHKGMNFPFQNY